MKNRIINKFFSSGIQAIGFQILGVYFFYYISLYFSKENFGLISWSNAVCMFLAAVLSFGMEQVVGRRIAVSKTSDWAAAAYLIHSLIGSLVILIILIVFRLVFTNSASLHYLPLFFLAQGIIYIASPLKQFLNAKEKFTPYAVIVIISNIGKISFAYVLVHHDKLSIDNIVLVQICFAVFEFLSLLTYILSKPQFDFKMRFKFSAYKKLLKESIPQYLAVIFDSSLSRMDWILLGLLSTSIVTADYSFAYRAYEITRLPISILAPIILPLFARMMVQNSKFDAPKKIFLENLFVVEMFLATAMILFLNIIWQPAITYITHGKYGTSNAVHFFILSFCIPMQFFCNLLWTLCFTGKKYRSVSTIIIVSAIINVVLNLVLIPFFGGTGAAIAFFITSVVQSIGYYRVVKREFLSLPVKYLVVFYLIGLFAYAVSYFITTETWLRLLISMSLYVLLCTSLKQIRHTHVNSLVELLKK